MSIQGLDMEYFWLMECMWPYNLIGLGFHYQLDMCCLLGHHRIHSLLTKDGYIHCYQTPSSNRSKLMLAYDVIGNVGGSPIATGFTATVANGI